MQTKTFDLTKYKNLSIKSFTLRELSGYDETAAYDRAFGPGQRAAALTVQTQLIADAIVEVDGQPVVTPYVDWQKWSLRTRGFVTAAYQRLNDVTADEMADFAQAAFGEAPERVATR